MFELVDSQPSHYASADVLNLTPGQCPSPDSQSCTSYTQRANILTKATTHKQPSAAQPPVTLQLAHKPLQCVFKSESPSL